MRFRIGMPAYRRQHLLAMAFFVGGPLALVAVAGLLILIRS
jgi:hypothetical protein